LAQAHPWAETAAEVAEFAGAHGKFWEMHDLLYENQDSFGEDLFPRLALMVKLSSAELQTAIAQQTYRARVRTDFSGGVRSGVNGTPTFFVNGQRHDGPFDISSLSAGIERSLGVYDR
jgi:protein-disulfide isomerase